MTSIDQTLLNKLVKDSSFINWAHKQNQNDIHYWNVWISSNPSKIETVDTAKSIVLGIQFEPTQISEDKVNSALQSVLKTVDSNAKKRKINTRVKKTVSSIPYGIAASIVLFFAIYLGANKLTPSTIEHETLYGEMINLRLPDGTSVILNGNSKISYEKDNPREVHLLGEAYFKVKPIPATNAKFRVHTNDLVVAVFGTKFHVNTHSKKTDVALDEGSIKLELMNGDFKQMQPGEFVSFSRSNNKLMQTTNALDDSYSLWREGAYVFNNKRLEEVMIKIKETYGLSSNFIDKELKDRIITGGIPNENIKICLSAIEKSTNTTITQQGNTLLIEKKDN